MREEQSYHKTELARKVHEERRKHAEIHKKREKTDRNNVKLAIQYP